MYRYGCVTILALTALAPCVAAADPVETVLASLGDQLSLGYNPSAGVIPGPGGSLIYETANGGAHDLGGVFRLSPPASGTGDWTGKLLFSFKGGTDGSTPAGGLIADTDGNLYGTTVRGGNTTCNTSGCGTVFKLIPPASGSGAYTERQLYAIPVSAAGVNPQAGLVANAQGALFGTTYGGGTRGYGTVFELTAPATASKRWTRATLHNFAGGGDGAIPVAGLVASASGVLFGTTTAGGANPGGLGTVFELTPPTTSSAWTYQKIYQFVGADGSTPRAALIVGTGGVLYGTTSAGGVSGLGTVFRLTPPTPPKQAWVEKVLYSFTGGDDGATPLGGVVADTSGNLYGTTSAGGKPGFGTVFELTPGASTKDPWTEIVLYSFAGQPDGATPYAGVLRDANGSLFGTTFSGGATNFGTLYELVP